MKKSLLFIVAALLLSSLACQAAEAINATDTPQPTNTPTDTATPAPTETNTPRPTPNLTQTTQARATRDAQEIVSFIEPTLENLGFSVDQGDLVWYQFNSGEVTATNPFSRILRELETEEPFQDFVIGVDITWESETGFAGCGIIFRSEENLERGRQAQFVTLRLSGLPAWSLELHEFGQFQSNLLGQVLTNASIRQGDGSTNSYIIVADGSSVTFYANDNRLGAGTLPAGMDAGSIGFFAWQESGRTTCTFDNVWIWALSD